MEALKKKSSESEIITSRCIHMKLLFLHVYVTVNCCNLTPMPNTLITFFPSRIVMFGGTGDDGITADTWTFSLTTNMWNEISSTNTTPPARFSMVYGVSNRYFYIATGEGPNKVFYNDIWRFNLDTDTWEEMVPPNTCSGTLPAVRYGSAGGIYPGQSSFLVSLGFSGDRHFDT